ncbi:MAG: radical SAM protein [Bacteroidales bacterium]|nr:radical SAM protein [Bacteroidales bacterium]
MKKKLILVFPVERTIVNFNAIAPPLGLGIIAALTPKHWDVEIIDENFEYFKYRTADLIGITSWTSNINRAYEIAQLCKSNNTPVVMGGPHVSALPEEALDYCDFVVTGMGEETWPLFLDDFENVRAERLYQGILSDKFVKPRHELFHKDYILGAIQTTRGCPMNCEFCFIPTYNGSKYYRKNPDDVVSELKEIPQKFVFFIDDNLGGFNKNHEKEAVLLFDKMIEGKINKYWYTQTSLNIALNEEFLKKAKLSGCGSVLIGFEAETEEALKSINKTLNIKLNPSLYNDYIKKIHKCGISVIATSIFGLENDTIDSMEKRADFLKQIKSAVILSTFLTAFPGTRFYDRMKKDDRLIYNNYPHDWKYYNCMRLTIKPAETNRYDVYEKNITRIMIKPFNPLRLLIRAVRTFLVTRDIIILLHATSTNFKYRNFILRKKHSYYRLRLILSKILYGNRTSNRLSKKT